MSMTDVLEYLEQSAARLPNKIAYTDEHEEVTFGELLLRAKRIGSALCARVDKGRPIGVFVGRTVETLCAFFGVLYSGNYYVPLDPAMPQTRLLSVLDGLSPAMLLYGETEKKEIDALCAESAFSMPLVCHGVLLNEIAVPDEETLSRRRAGILDIDPVYIIYTSGSTGTPKGIVISHRAVLDFTDCMAQTLGYREDDVFANQAPFYFDCSVKDIYLTLKLGATDHILPKKLFLFPTLLIDELNRRGVTALTWATSAFHLVSSSGILEKKQAKALRIVALGGEALSARHVNNWKKAHPQVTYVNLYGPTEVTVDCTYHILERDYADDEAIPIGKAFANKEVLLLDDALCPVPDGETGEICVRGAGVAKGYYNEPEKTAAAFVQNSRACYPDILYRTGDIGRKNEKGDIVFLCRRDGQIKHMGYRIELGEIERALGGIARDGGIGEAICFHDASRDRIVCAYEGTLSSKELANALTKRLPKYMIPNIYLPYTAFPHNANGKIDRVKIKRLYDEQNNHA